MIFLTGCKDDDETPAGPAPFSVSSINGLWSFQFDEVTVSCDDGSTKLFSASLKNVIIQAPTTSDDYRRYLREGKTTEAGDVTIGESAANFILSGDTYGIGAATDSGNSIFVTFGRSTIDNQSYHNYNSYIMDFANSPTSGSTIYTTKIYDDWPVISLTCTGSGQMTAEKQ